VAEKAQLSPKAVSTLERGARRRPHRVTVALIADALALNAADRAQLERAARTSLPSSAPATRGLGNLPVGAFLGAAPSGRMVARANELAALAAAVHAVEAGEGRTVLLAGEPGVGKTRLAQEIHDLLRRSDFLTAVGRCYEPRASVPYFPFLDATSALFAKCPEHFRVQAGERWPHLGVLLPDQQNFPSAAPGAHDEQVLVFRAAAGFLTELAGAGPVAILVDDVQWADVSSLQLLHHLARETRTDRVLLCATYRDTDVGRETGLALALRDMRREGLLDEIAVPRLGREATEELVADILGERELSEELGEFVYRRAEGNPYYVGQLAGALTDGSGSDALSSIGVPNSIRSLVEQRMSRLPEESREALREASILGQAFTLDDLRATTGRSEHDLDRALQDATSFGLVRETDREAYSFDHGLTQQTLYHQLPAGRRKRLHVAAGEAIASLHDRKRSRRLAELAWHYLQAGDEVEAIRWSLEAARSAWSISALAEAEHHYQAASILAEETGDTAAWAQSLEGLGRLSNVAGRYEAATAALEETDELYRLGRDDVGRARVAAELGGLYAMAGHTDRGIGLVREALGRLTAAGAGLGPAPEAELHAVLAQLLWPVGRRIEALAATRRAGELAREAGESRTQGWADMQEALMLESLGRRAEALAAAQAALGFVERGRDDELLWYCLSVLTSMQMARGDLIAARDLIGRGLEAAKRRGDPQYLAASLAEMGRYLTWTGEWGEADRVLVEAVDCVEAGDPILGFVHVQQAQLSLWRGDIQELDTDLQRVVEASVTGGNLDRLTAATLLLADLDLLTRAPQRALSRLEQLAERSGFTEAEPGYGIQLASTYLALGQLEQAEEVLDRFTPPARADNLRLSLIDLERLRAELLLARGQCEEALPAAGEALQLARALPAPFKEGHAHFTVGRIQIRSHREQEGLKTLEEAWSIFRRLGAHGEASRVEQERAEARLNSEV
jgi:tetratricopeptide (TPR) repeat protein